MKEPRSTVLPEKWDKPFLLMPTPLARWMLVGLFALAVYFFYGFIVPVLIALVISVATWPLYQRLLARVHHRRTLAATIALIIAIIFLVAPLVIMAGFAINEVGNWFRWATEVNQTGAPVPQWLASLPVVGEWLAEQWDQYIGHPGMIGEITRLSHKEGISGLYHSFIAASGSLLHVVLNVIFVLITLFFLYRDGLMFVAQLDRVGEYVFPARWTRFSRIVPLAINSTVVGMGIIAIGEGIILGLAYWIAGVPSPVVLGLITGVMALIPGGAPLCFTLVSGYLLASGATMEGVLLFAWGCTELFFVDKFLRPRLVGGPMQMPFLPTFFGLIGGVKTMGFLGLFIGPALMALMVTIWREAVKELAPAPAEPEGPQADG